MDNSEFSGIHIDSSSSPLQLPRDQSSDSIRPTTSATSPPTTDLVIDSLPRRRNNVPNGSRRSSDETELDKLRKLVAEAEIERRHSGGGGSQRGSIEPSLMSAVFGLVLAIIITITVYAFFSLYRALMKKFYHQ